MTKRRNIAAARAARDAVMDELRIDGLQAAYRRAIKILEDDRAPVTAQAQLVRVIFNAAGLTPNEADEDDKPLEQMTAAELAREAAKARASLDDGGSASDVFR